MKRKNIIPGIVNHGVISNEFITKDAMSIGPYIVSMKFIGSVVSINPKSLENLLIILPDGVWS